jgi:CheY-like chemotaxis protein
MSPARKPRILLIDDDPDAGELMVELLRLRGYSCDVTLSADSGLRCWREQRHEVVVSDINLRHCSGLEVARSLVRETQRPILIALTGHIDRASRRESRAAGFDYHVVKPIELEQFEALLAPRDQSLPAH